VSPAVEVAPSPQFRLGVESSEDLSESPRRVTARRSGEVGEMYLSDIEDLLGAKAPGSASSSRTLDTPTETSPESNKAAALGNYTTESAPSKSSSAHVEAVAVPAAPRESTDEVQLARRTAVPAVAFTPLLQAGRVQETRPDVVATFVLISGESCPLTFKVRRGKMRTVILGRAPQTDVPLDLSGVSWRHLELRALPLALGPAGGTKLQLFARDVSSNGTGLRHKGKGAVQRLSRNVDTPIEDGSELILPMKVTARTGEQEDEVRKRYTVRIGGAKPDERVSKMGGKANTSSQRTQICSQALGHGEVIELLAELGAVADGLNPADYWRDGAWDMAGLREDVLQQREEMGYSCAEHLPRLVAARETLGSTIANMGSRLSEASANSVVLRKWVVTEPPLLNGRQQAPSFLTSMGLVAKASQATPPPRNSSCPPHVLMPPPPVPKAKKRKAEALAKAKAKAKAGLAAKFEEPRMVPMQAKVLSALAVHSFRRYKEADDAEEFPLCPLPPSYVVDTVEVKSEDEGGSVDVAWAAMLRRVEARRSGLRGRRCWRPLVGKRVGDFARRSFLKRLFGSC